MKHEKVKKCMSSSLAKGSKFLKIDSTLPDFVGKSTFIELPFESFDGSFVLIRRSGFLVPRLKLHRYNAAL